MKKETAIWAFEEVKGLAMSLFAHFYNIFEFGGQWADHESSIMPNVEGPNHKVIFQNKLTFKPVSKLGR